MQCKCIETIYDMDFLFDVDSEYEYTIENNDYYIQEKDSNRKLFMGEDNFKKHFKPIHQEYFETLKIIESMKDDTLSHENESGIEDDPQFLTRCESVFHSPPSHIVIPHGKRYRHVCPDCGYTTFIYPNDITCTVGKPNE